MDITKRFDRILGIYFFLQSKSFIKIEDFVKRFNVSERTIFRDMKALERAGVPLINEAGRGYAIMEGFRIQPTRFSEEEILSLIVAEKFIQKSETQNIRKHFESALIKIKSSFRTMDKNSSYLLDNNVQIKKNLQASYLPDVLEVLLKAIIKKQKTSIGYVKNNEHIMHTRNIEAIGVFHETAHWYVMGYCHLRKDYRNFRLDRIKKIEFSQEPFELEHPDLEQLRLKEKNKPATKITLKIDKKYAQYMHWTRDNYGYIKEKEEGKYIFMDFNYDSNPMYFIRWLMTYADIAEIVKPVSLRNELKEIINKACDRVNKMK